jgi:hypothetical protein
MGDCIMKKKKFNGNVENRKAYSEFKEECLRQMGRLGLKEWDITVQHGFLEGEEDSTAATTQMEETGKLAVITLNKKFIPRDPKRVAKHEVCHVLLGKIQALAAKRWTSEDEVDGEIEALCTRLEKVL